MKFIYSACRIYQHLWWFFDLDEDDIIFNYEALVEHLFVLSNAYLGIKSIDPDTINIYFAWLLEESYVFLRKKY